MPKRKLSILLAAVVVMLMLVAAAEAQTCQDCSPSELEIGTCTPLTYLDASPTGYVLRLLPGNPFFDGTDTISEYEVCLKDGYNPSALSHADLEFKVCDGSGCSAIDAEVNGFTATFEQFAAGTGGDPSSGYGADWGADLVKIELPENFQNGTFSVTVAGRAYATLGKIGFKTGEGMMVGNLLLPVCSAECPLVTFSAFAEQTVTTETGYEFDLICNGSTGCCEVIACRNPDGSARACNKSPIDEFLQTSKDGNQYSVETITTDGKCLNLVGDDTREHSPWYGSGGYAWY